MSVLLDNSSTGLTIPVTSHGSWDSPENQVGNIVMAHTNITEIQDALNLLWRNDVPANKVNLGIGFYGRTYELEDPSVCPFTRVFQLCAYTNLGVY